MRLALQTDYALRTLMYLARTGQRTTAQTVARFYGISAAHVSKVVNQLARQGYIRSIRGIGGGIELKRSVSEIRIGEVIRTFEGQMHLLECVHIDDVCAIQSFCKLRNVLSQAEKIQMDYLDEVTLSDVLPTQHQMRRHAAGLKG